jgi:hypothetical protein
MFQEEVWVLVMIIFYVKQARECNRNLYSSLVSEVNMLNFAQPGCPNLLIFCRCVTVANYY